MPKLTGKINADLLYNLQWQTSKYKALGQISQKDIDKAILLYISGMSLKKVSEQTRIYEKTLSTLLKKNKIEIRGYSGEKKEANKKQKRKHWKAVEVERILTESKDDKRYERARQFTQLFDYDDEELERLAKTGEFRPEAVD